MSQTDIDISIDIIDWFQSQRILNTKHINKNMNYKTILFYTSVLQTQEHFEFVYW